MDLVVLKAELTVDPLGCGYSTMTDEEAAASLNTVCRTVDVETVTGQEIFEAVVPAHYNALSAEYKQLFGLIVGMGTIMVNGTNTKAALLAMFTGATETLQALAALQTEEVSRAVELKLGLVYPGHIQNARM